MISQGGSGGWINVGPQINTLNVVGGRIANVAKSGNAITRNIFFDQRFAGGDFAPPWYPSTTVTASNTNSSAFSAPTVQRLQWYLQVVIPVRRRVGRAAANVQANDGGVDRKEWAPRRLKSRRRSPHRE